MIQSPIQISQGSGRIRRIPIAIGIRNDKPESVISTNGRNLLYNLLSAQISQAGVSFDKAFRNDKKTESVISTNGRNLGYNNRKIKFCIFIFLEYFVYILTNKTKTTLYVGFTNNVKIRVYQHSNPEEGSNSFTKRYKVFYLVYYEKYNDVIAGIAREKQIKKWRREKKDKLISDFNPEWRFLNDELDW